MIEEISEKEFNEKINENKKVIVDMYADWCYPCKILKPILEELSKEYKEIKFLKVNVDENMELANKFSVTSIPTLLFFKNSKLVNRIVGAYPKSKLKEVIENTFD